MTFPKPIRYDVDTWLVMRTNPVLPKAVIQRVHGTGGDRYLLFKWDLDPAKRVLVSMNETLEKANEQVLYDQPNNARPGLPQHEFPHGEPTADASTRPAGSAPDRRP